MHMTPTRFAPGGVGWTTFCRLWWPQKGDAAPNVFMAVWPVWFGPLRQTPLRLLRPLLFAWLLLGNAPAVAQELEPRSYVNIPIGLNFLLLGYGHTEGNVAPSPNVPIENAFIQTNALVLGYARSFALRGSSAKFDVQTSRACYEGRADILGEPVSASRCEWGDTRARISWNIIGAPALTPGEYRQKFKPGFTLGASLQIEAPTGSYDSDKVINAGANRWTVRPGIGLSYIWEGWYLDASADIKFYTDNDNYLGARISQDPLYQLQVHLARYFAPGAWISLNSNYYLGGESSRDGNPLEDDLDNARLGVTVSFPIAPGHSLRLNASKGVITRLGTDFDTMGITYQYRF